MKRGQAEIDLGDEDAPQETSTAEGAPAREAPKEWREAVGQSEAYAPVRELLEAHPLSFPDDVRDYLLKKTGHAFDLIAIRKLAMRAREKAGHHMSRFHRHMSQPLPGMDAKPEAEAEMPAYLKDRLAKAAPVKIAFLDELFRKNRGMTASDASEQLRKEFGTGLHMTIVRLARKRAKASPAPAKPLRKEMREQRLATTKPAVSPLATASLVLPPISETLGPATQTVPIHIAMGTISNALERLSKPEAIRVIRSACLLLDIDLNAKA